MNRREFSKVTIMGAFTAFLFSLVGCSWASVEADIEAYVPLLLQAFTGILSLFDPPLAATLAPFTTLVQSGITAILNAIANWKAADAAQKPGLVGDIIATLQTVETDLANFLAAIKVNAPAQLGAVTALVDILLGVLESFVNKLTPVAPASARKAAVLVRGNPIVPLDYSSKQFKAAFNHKCAELGVTKAQIR